MTQALPKYIQGMMTMKNKDFKNLKKAGIFTDIHLGRKNASEIHNSDCFEFIQWFVQKCKDNNVDHIIFCGDWFEHRDSISGKTLDWSHKCIKYIEDNLNLPFFFIIGNHDLVYRNTRNAFNTKIFEPFQNMVIVDDNFSTNIAGKTCLFCPYLFPGEYSDQIKNINSHEIIYGHFEFKGFVVTGETKVLDHGPEHEDFKKPKRIFTGHFHKRQNKGNVYYLGNTFPMDYSDANDKNRGMAVYDYQNDALDFIDWENAPIYVRCDFSDLIDKPKKFLRSKATVRCIVDDTELGYEDVLEIKNYLMEKYYLRELRLEEPSDDYTISDDLDPEDLKSESTTEIVNNLLEKISSKEIKPAKLKKIYKELT